MTPEQIERLRIGIAAYEPQQQMLLSAIERHGGALTDREFDHEFSDIARDAEGRPVRRAAMLWMGITPETIILAPMQASRRAKFIHLAQIMATLGDIEIAQEGGHVVYRLPEGEKTQ